MSKREAMIRTAGKNVRSKTIMQKLLDTREKKGPNAGLSTNELLQLFPPKEVSRQTINKLAGILVIQDCVHRVKPGIFRAANPETFTEPEPDVLLPPATDDPRIMIGAKLALNINTHAGASHSVAFAKVTKEYAIRKDNTRVFRADYVQKKLTTTERIPQCGVKWTFVPDWALDTHRGYIQLHLCPNGFLHTPTIKYASVCFELYNEDKTYTGWSDLGD
jgi:hypothetical protein